MMSPSPEEPCTIPPPETAEYSLDERALLLKLAHDSIYAELESRHLDLSPPSVHLAEARGAFTSLHLGRALRGCIGYVFPTQALYQTVAETAKAAAFEDPRFEPVTPAEAQLLRVEISILSPLFPIQPGQVVLGRHGLVIAQGTRKGLLLPQVPLEWEWDRETFLSQTCLKAGLSPDAWQHGAELRAFTAEVFGEE